MELADCEVLYVDNTSDGVGLNAVLQSMDLLDLQNCSADDHIKAMTIKSLLFRSRFDQFSDPKDLDCAVEAARLATNSSTGKVVRLHVSAWENYGNQLSRRAEIRQSIDDMNAAVEAAETALQVCPIELVLLRSQMHAALGRRLDDKWSLFGDPEDLLASTEPLRSAVTALPKGHGSRALYLHNLAHGLRNVFVHSGSIEALDESILAEREALSIVSRDDAHRYVMLDGLSLSLGQRFRRLQHSEDLNEMIRTSEDALAGTPKS